MAERRTVPTAARSPRRRFSRSVALIAALWVALAGVFLSSEPASAFDEATIHSLVNQSRAENGLGPLTLNAAMSQVALTWANQMAASGVMSHNPEYASQIPGGWSMAAENVAQGYPSGSAVHQGWMNSDGHRANILGDFTDIGIAHISAGGTTWSVEVFAKYGGSVPAPAPPPAPPPAPAPAPPPVEAAPPPVPEPAPAPSTSAPPSSQPDDQTAVPSPPSLEPEQDAAGTAEQGGDPVTKLVLGIALLASVAVAIAGWLRMRVRR